MAVNVADLIARLTVDVSGFKTGLDQAARQMQTFSGLVDQSGRPIASSFQGVTDQAKKLGAESEKLTSGPLKNLQQAFLGVANQGTSLLGGFAPLLVGLGGVATAIGLTTLGVVKSVEAFTGFATQVRDLSYLSGGSARDVSVLVNGLENLGVNAETVELGLNRMSAEITSGGESLSKLGISIRDTSGNLKSGLTLFYETVDALGRMTNAVERNSLAREIFGRGWTQMLPVLQRGSGVIKEMGEEAFALGKAIDEGGIEKAYEFQKSMRDLGDAWEGFKIQVGGGIVAPITYVLKWVTTTGTEIPGGPRESQDWLEAVFGRVLAEQIRGGPPKTLTVPGWSDVGAAGLGGTPRALTTGGLGPAELEKQVKLNTQLAQLDAQRLAALAAAMPMGLARIAAEKEAMEAALKVKQIQMAGELDLRDLTKKTTDEQAETARLRVGTSQMFAAQRVAIEKDAEEKARQERLRILKIGNQDMARLLDEESILQSDNFKNNIQAQYDEFLSISKMAENYREIERKKRAEFASVGAYDYEAIYAEGIKRSDEEIAKQRQAMRETDLQHQYVALADQADALKKAMDDGLISYQTYHMGIERLRERNSEINKQALLAELYAADNYFDKMRLGLAYHVTDWRTANQIILDSTTKMAEFAHQQVSDIFFAGLTGQIKDFEDVWRAAWNSLARIAADELSRLTLSTLFGSLTGGGGAGWLGPAISTGWNALSTWGSDLGSWLGFLQGGMWEVPDLPGKEVAVLHPGEMVVPPGMAANLRAMFGSPAGFVAGQTWGSGGGAEMQAPGRGPTSPGEVLANTIGAMLTSGEQMVFGLAHAANALWMGAKLFGATNPLVGALGVFSAASLAQSINAYALSTAAGITMAQAQGIVAGLAQLSITNGAIVSALISTDLEDIAQGAAMQAAQVSIDAAITAQAFIEAALTQTGYTAGWEAGTSSEGFGDGGGYGGYGDQGSSTTGSDASTGGPGESLQHGGPVRAGRPYLVGEAGPELIIPRGAGTVVPNRETREAMGGGVTINVNMHGDVYGAGGRDDFIRRVASDLRQFIQRIPGASLTPARA